MPPDWDFTLYFTDAALRENDEAVAWLKVCEERVRQELHAESSYEEALGDGLVG